MKTITLTDIQLKKLKELAEWGFDSMVEDLSEEEEEEYRQITELLERD